MDIQEIKRRFELLKMANNERYCLLSELAKELKVRKTDLMQFVIDNPKLFRKGSVEKKGKNMGTCLFDVYLLPEDNPKTEEWLQKQIVEKAKYIYISEFDNYGCIEGYFVVIDKEDSSNKNKEWLWRNTEQKVKEIQKLGATHKNTFYFGGYGDCTEHPVEYAISSDGLQKLKQAGWTFNELKPLSR